MAAVYDTMNKRIVSSVDSVALGDSAQLSAGVVIAVLPFKTQSTYDFSAQNSVTEPIKPLPPSPTPAIGQRASVGDIGGHDYLDPKSPPPQSAGFDEATENFVALDTKGFWQIQNLCYEVTVTHSKASHVGSLSAVFLDPKEALYSNLAPGDWIVCWMLDNEVDQRSVSAFVYAGKEANGFDDGLKFVGRIDSIRRTVVVDGNGNRSRRIAIQASSFTELDSPIYWNPALALSDNDTNSSWFGVIKRGKELDALIGDLTQSLCFVDEAILALLLVFLGAGPSKESKNLGKAKDSAVVSRSPNEAYLVPKELGRLLGATPSLGDNLRYCDVLHVVSGIQSFENNLLFPDFNPEEEKKRKLKGFESLNNFTVLDRRLIGRMSPVSTPWANVPIWQILAQYGNLEANEMYTTLHVAYDGTVQPTMILRQQPFTSDSFSIHDYVTRFSSLPRWLVHEQQVTSEDLGRSNALRCNFVSVIAMPAGLDDPTGSIEVINRSYSPPITDRADIKRSGLRPLISTLNVDTFLANPVEVDFPSEAPKKKKKVDKVKESIGHAMRATKHWSSLIADFHMGGHMRETGGLTLHGIQAPIPVGDNIEYRGNLYHIESITHKCSKRSDGKVSFTTSLTLTHGTSIVPGDPNAPWPHISPDPTQSTPAQNLDEGVPVGTLKGI